MASSRNRPGPFDSNERGRAFSSEVLLAELAKMPTPQSYRVGYSGGADSTALLQAMYEASDRLAAPFDAVHFHHGLHDAAESWLEHCRAFCNAREITLSEHRLGVCAAAGVSPEEAARNARYAALSERLCENDLYLTAHHAEDQAETLFLNLMRGSGIDGLAGIPVLRTLGGGWVGRPLLGVSRSALRAYLLDRSITWITDPSNRDTRFDRNFVRREVFPMLETRWPGVTGRLSRVSRHARDTAGAVAAFIERRAGHLLADPLRMPLKPLRQLEPELRTLVFRHWLRTHEVPPLPEARLREFLQQLAPPSHASQAELRWSGWTLKRYREAVWLYRETTPAACPKRDWRSGDHLELGGGLGNLVLGGAAKGPAAGWSVRSRQHGDRLRVHDSGPARPLKDLFQASSVPPWLRGAIPLLCWHDQPVALGDWLLAERLRNWLDSRGCRLAWHPENAILKRVRDEARNALDAGPDHGRRPGADGAPPGQKGTGRT